MQLVVESTIQGSTSETILRTYVPKQPLSIPVSAGQKLRVVYGAPAGQQSQLRFYVGQGSCAPTATSTAGAAPSGTRISQVGQTFTDSAGNKWSLGPPNPAVEGGRCP